MKIKIFNIIVLVSLFLFTSSCEDFLTVTPTDSLSSENAIESLEDYNNVVRSCYVGMRSGDFSDFMLIVPDVMSDNLLICSDGRFTWNEFFNFEFNSTTFGTAGLWLSCYNTILSANEVITRLESDNSSLKDDEDAKQILAEALTVRAYMHFVLVRWYGKSYTTASETDLGVPYKTSTLASEKPARETVKDVYTKILADLIKAKGLMKQDYNSSINNRVNIKSLNAILAKVYFNMGDYDNTIIAAKLAVKNDGTDVVTVANYTKMWTTSMNIPEVLLRVSVLQTDDEIPGNVYGQGDASSHKPEYVVSNSFANLFDPNTDIRSAEIQEVTLSGKKYNAVWKYHGRTGESTGKVDIPLIRTSEMYLTIAEALLRKTSPDYTNARQYLNYVRDNRYAAGSVPAITDANLLDAVTAERRLELAFEGDRFFEIKRLNQDINRDDKGDLSDGSGVSATVQTIVKTSPYYLMAIPQDEINANSNMKQNDY